MSVENIRTSVEAAIAYLSDHPEDARSTDSAAVATIEDGLRVRVEGPGGAVVVSDMPPGVGGGGAAPSPGWYLRAGLACCDATMVALRAAALGIGLSDLEVTVDSVSDDRGLLGVDDAVPAGPLEVRIKVRLAAEGVEATRLREVVEWAETHSPVRDALGRAVLTTLELTTG